MVEETDLDAMMDNLEKAKERPGDGRERAEKRSRRAKKSNIQDTTDPEYKKDANYRFACPECSWEAYRKQARQDVRKVVENPERGRCGQCGHEGITVETL